MKLTVNGQERQVMPPQTVHSLLAELGLADRPVAVEVNRRIVRKKAHEQTVLQEGDVVELVTLVGGG